MRQEGSSFIRRSQSNQNSEKDSHFKRQQSVMRNMAILGPSYISQPVTEPRQNFLIPQLPRHQANESNNEGYSNVFAGFRNQEQPKVIDSKTNIAQSYQRQCLEYQKYLFDNRIKAILKRMTIKAYNTFKHEKEGQFFIFPIQKLLATIAKKLLLNRFQLLFLQYVFEQTKWRYDFECIRKYVTQFKSYMMIPDSQAPSTQLKLMQVYILFCAFFSKKSLNDLSNENMFTTFCNDICTRFKQYFTQWTQSSQMGARIKPKQLNSIFKRLTANFQRDYEDSQNYCLFVQQIIDISPAYNADKSGKQKKVRKNKKKQALNRDEQQINGQSDYKQDSQIKYNNQIIQQHQESLGLDPLYLKQKKSSVLSVQLLDPGHYLTRSLSQNQRK